jgi:uncharacterized membrane protein
LNVIKANKYVLFPFSLPVAVLVADSLLMQTAATVREPTMGITKTALLVIGILAVVIGLIWIGQGTGYFPYPATSFMINQMPWVYWGALLAAVGLAAIVVSRWI